MTKRDDIVTRLEALINKIKPAAPITFREDANLKEDYGLDSLDTMMLLFDLEKEFGVKIPEQDVETEQLLVAGRLVGYVQARTQDAGV